MPPGTEFARRSIDAIVKNVQDRVYHNVLGITGPFLLMSVFDSLEVKDKAFFNFLAFDQPVFDFSIYSQEPGQEEAQKLRKDRVVIFHNGEYRRHSSSTGAGSYEKMFNDCQVYGEKTPSTKCHVQNPESVKNASNILHTMQLLVFTLTLASFTFISSR